MVLAFAKFGLPIFLKHVIVIFFYYLIRETETATCMTNGAKERHCRAHIKNQAFRALKEDAKRLRIIIRGIFRFSMAIPGPAHGI